MNRGISYLSFVNMWWQEAAPHKERAHARDCEFDLLLDVDCEVSRLPAQVYCKIDPKAEIVCPFVQQGL